MEVYVGYIDKGSFVTDCIENGDIVGHETTSHYIGYETTEESTVDGCFVIEGSKLNDTDPGVESDKYEKVSSNSDKLRAFGEYFTVSELKGHLRARN